MHPAAARRLTTRVLSQPGAQSATPDARESYRCSSTGARSAGRALRADPQSALSPTHIRVPRSLQSPHDSLTVGEKELMNTVSIS